MRLASSLVLFILLVLKNCIARGEPEPDRTNIHWGRLAITSALGIGIAAYAIDYEMDTWGRTRGKFHFKDDWDGDFLAQTDELSHFFYAYKMTQFGYLLARFDGFSTKTSIIIGSSIAFLWLFSVEYPIDAYNPSQGFGFSDLIFNALGAGFSSARLLNPKLQALDFRISFKKSPLKLKGIIAQTADDYDNIIYWLTFTPYRSKNPLNIAIGYSTRRPTSNWRIVKREYFFSIGTSFSDFTELIIKRKPLIDFLGFLQFPFGKYIETE